MRSRAGIWTAWGLAIASTAFAIGDEYKTDAAWTKGKPHGEPQVGGYYMNLGPTGIRAQLRELAFEVKYVFPDSPAAGRVQPGDLIVGVNDRPFKTPHTFGFDWNKAAKTGYEGPMMDFGTAIEESEGKEGVLTLMVKRGDKPSSVKLQIRPLGKFSPTFPYKCRKSDLIYQEICEYLAKTPNDWAGGGVTAAAGGLALLASGNPPYLKHAERAAKSMTRLNPLDPEGLNNWNLTYAGIFLGEYHLATGDASVLRTLFDVHKGLEFAQTAPGVLQHQKNWGGYSELGIMEGLAITAYAMIDKCRVEFDPKTYELFKKRVRYITSRDGCVHYARDSKPGWDQEPLKLDGNAGPGEAVGRGGAAMLGFYLISGADPQAGAYVTNVGEYLTRYMQYFPDCHACPGVGIHLMGLGLAVGYPEGFRKVMDYHKAYFNLMRTHEPGKFVALPSRSDSCDLSFPAAFTSANIGLLLGVKEKRLQVGGAPLKPGRGWRGVPNGAKPAGQAPAAAAKKEEGEKPKPVVRPDTVAAWDARLQARIREELQAGRKPRFKWTALGDWADIAEIGPKADLRIEGRDGAAQQSWSAISLPDRRNIAVALVRNGQGADHALAAFYHMVLGEADRAQVHLGKAGSAADEVKAAFQ
jgi:hypothetical protein